MFIILHKIETTLNRWVGSLLVILLCFTLWLELRLYAYSLWRSKRQSFCPFLIQQLPKNYISIKRIIYVIVVQSYSHAIFCVVTRKLLVLSSTYSRVCLFFCHCVREERYCWYFSDGNVLVILLWCTLRKQNLTNSVNLLAKINQSNACSF